MEKEIEDSEKHQLAYKYVFEDNGHKWSNNNGEAGDNYGSFIAGYEAAEKQQDEMMIKFIDYCEEQKQIWKCVLDRPLFHTKEDQIRASASYMALNAMLLNFKEQFKNSLKQ